ncbi:MAG TPA: ABC transporter substrate-binding protein [Casimicrobiaceae bacterium]|nr:ABC transporter substrate-binding protein [Casimicrobiaceae bacterium]
MSDLARRFLAALLFVLSMSQLPAVAAADMHKVLRISSPDITSLDPQQGTDLYSTRVASAIFEAPYEFEYLSTGSKVIPNTAESMPSITDDGKMWTIKLEKGIYFADDPVFKGKKRELVAADYAYSIRRVLDPNLRSGGDPALTDLIVGARSIVDQARKPGGKFDYDAPIEGLRTPDRYTLVIRLAHPDYTMLERLAGLNMMAVAREAIEAAGADVMRRPVGTGPYVLKEWRPASRVVLEANPNYRKVVFPENADAPQQGLVRSMRGKTMPSIGRIEISIIEESQPEILAFTQGDLDYIGLGGDDTKRVMIDGKLRPDLVARGIRHLRFGSPSVTFTYFNMDDPIVGGYSTAQIALRRAIGMGFDVDEMIRVLFAGNALPANQLLPPGVSGHDPSLPPHSLYDPAAARALLDRFGFKDRHGDGYRETPDGKRLTVVRGTLPESWYREADTLWKKNMDAIGIRMKVEQQTFAELLNLSRAGKLPMFNLGYRSLEPSGYQILQTLWSKSPRDTNPSQFHNADYDAAYEAFLRTPAGPQRVALARRMSQISQAYMPMILHTYGVGNVLYYPWVEGYWPSPFGFSWKYLDIDVAMRDAKLREMRK